MNSGFLPHFNKQLNVVNDSPAKSRGQGKYMKCISFPSPSLEVALSGLNIHFFVKNNILKKN
jgi:hypothetical protein